MVRAFILFLTLCVAIFGSCTKDQFITGKNAFLITSDTAIHFDTVFTSAGSITKQLKIFNINEQKLRISNLQLVGGANSVFKINVNGTPGTGFSNLEMEGGDSLYVFVSVNIDPGAAVLPFLVEDSIRIEYNGNVQFVKLDAFGQNAHFLRSTVLSQNTTWKADLPYVLLDTFAVAAGATLTIEKGARIYCHANTPFTVAGSLQVNGTSDSAGRVTFQNDRLDAPYKDQPGTWEGLYFSPNSTGNLLNYTTIRNALHGVAADSKSNVQLNGCRIENCAGEALAGYNATVSAVNCLFANSSYNVYCTAGGNYTFTHCTIAAFSTRYLYHQYPGITFANVDANSLERHPLQAVVSNSIIYGEDGLVADEVEILNETGTSFNISFENTLYKSPGENESVSYVNCLSGAYPQFQTIDTENNVFDFHLSEGSPCIDAGSASGITSDLDGRVRKRNTGHGLL